MKKYTPKHEKPNKTHLKVKRFILKSTTYLMIIVFVISTILSFTINENYTYFYIPLAALVVSGGWLYLIIWANGYTHK